MQRPNAAQVGVFVTACVGAAAFLVPIGLAELAGRPDSRIWTNGWLVSGLTIGAVGLLAAALPVLTSMFGTADASTESESRSQTRQQAEVQTVPRSIGGGGADPGIRPHRAGPQPSPLSTGDRDGLPFVTRRRVPLKALAGLVVVAVAAGSISGFLLERAPKPRSATTASHQFPARHYSDGLLVARAWTTAADGTGSLFTEQIDASVATRAAMTVVFTDPVPAALVAHISDAQFKPADAAPTVVNHGRDVRWRISLPAGGRVVLTYQLALPGDRILATQLDEWVHAFSRLLPSSSSVAVGSGPTPRSLTVRPDRVHLSAGQTKRLSLSGRMRDGKNAPAAALDHAVWMTQNASIARVDSNGDVTAIRAGRTKITIRLGSLRVSVVVIVSRRQPQPSSGNSAPNPGTGSSAPSHSSKPSPHPTPTYTPTTI